MRLKGDEGARRLIGALNADELVEVKAPDLGATFDIDTPETWRPRSVSGAPTDFPD